MADVKVTVDSGVCRFKTVIAAEMNEEMNITFKVKSECPAVREMAKSLRPASLMDIMAMPFAENIVYKDFATKLAHVCCPVPSAMIKASEVAGDMALKRNVIFDIE